jgi:hypothetical protein
MLRNHFSENLRVLFLRNPKVRFIMTVSEKRPMTIASLVLRSIYENTLKQAEKSSFPGFHRARRVLPGCFARATIAGAFRSGSFDLLCLFGCGGGKDLLRIEGPVDRLYRALCGADTAAYACALVYRVELLRFS